MDASPPKLEQQILCRTCAHYALERYKVGNRWQEGRRCIRGIRFAGERTECMYYSREPGSDGD